MRPYFFLGISLAVFLLLVGHNVPLSLAPVDKAAVQELLAEAHVSEPEGSDYASEVQFILDVQMAVQTLIAEDRPVPFGQRREPSDLNRLRYGLCYDRSRLIEAICRDHGFQTRHIALYYGAGRLGGLELLLRQGKSHALSEVRTSRGWMLVDPNYPVAGIDAQGNPVSLKMISRDKSARRIAYPPQYDSLARQIYYPPTLFVYGLYSRHGRFFPPFTPLPDMNLSEIMQNLPRLGWSPAS